MKNRVDEFVKNPKKALFKLAMPIVIAMFVHTMYNIVDTAFVGRLGAEAIAALTFSFPVFFILIGINSGIATGMSSRIARFLGAKKKIEAENTAMHGIGLSIFFGLLVFFFGVRFLRPMFVLFGAQDNVLTLSIGYMTIILIGAVFMFVSYAMNSIFAAQGDTKTPMKVQIASLVLNVVLDPIFIYGLKLGVNGAALATTISFVFGLVLYIYYITRKSYLKIHPSSFKYSFPIFKEIIVIGVPSSLTILLLSVYVIFINKFMAHFGVDYVAASGLASRLESVAVMPIVAISLSLLTLIGMFFGAKRFDLLKSTIWYGLKMGIAFTVVVGLIFFIFPELFLRIFTSEDKLLSAGSAYLRIDVLTFPLMAIAMMISRVMQAMGSGIPGLVINIVRVFIVAIPLAYVFVFVFGMGFLSVAWAMVLGGVASSIVAIIWLEVRLKKLNSG